MKAKLHLVLSTAIFFVSFCAISQQNYWQEAQAQPSIKSADKHYFQLNQKTFLASLENDRNAKGREMLVHFPDENGQLIAFKVKEASVMHPDLAKKYPQIKSYVGWSEDSNTKVRFSTSHRGVQVMFRDMVNQKTLFIQKESRTSEIYEMHSGKLASSSFACKTVEANLKEKAQSGLAERLVDDQTLRTYRLAVSASGEYTEYHGGTVADALAAINATVTRINEVFSTDLGVALELIANNDDVIFTNAELDPYTTGSELLGEIQDELETTIGAANFDIGHLFHLDDDNGNAGGIGTVCSTIKGRAFSSALIPETDLYDLDYVGHEMGHQLGANHTWSFDAEGTGVQAEPGSGTTIMGYAGITGINNVAPNGDDYFHHNSIQQITTYIRSQSCSVNTALANNVPVLVENLDYSIPAGTAFVLTGTASDSDAGDNLSYCWEQIDSGVVTRDNFGPENPAGANFRSLPPTADPSRYFPRLSRVVLGQLTQTLPVINSPWETVSTVSREFNFALTVRDNAAGGGQVASEEVKVDVIDTGSPFAITSQTEESQQYAAGSVINVEWDVAGTNLPPFNVDFVDVFLSLDGGVSFPITIATGITNDGSAGVQLPGDVATEARIMIRPTDNIFFAVNAENFEIVASDFILNFDVLEFEVCKPDNLTVNFVYEAFGGFTGTSDLTTTLPAGLSASFTPAVVTTTDTAVSLELTDISALDVGSYPVQVLATSGTTTSEVELLLHVFDSNLADAVLTSPLNLATETRVNPTLVWEADANHASYEIQIAIDEAFSTIIESAILNETSYESNNLESSTTYYWRVKPINNCAEGNFSAPFSFSTISIDCLTISAEGLPISISDGAPSTVTSMVSLTQDLPISEIELALEMEHTYLGDLVISLISPAGTKVLMTNNSCGSLDNINAIFDDEGSDIVCTGDPAISGTVKPVSSFSAFQGESTQGDWILEIQDTASGDGGSVINFSITFCVEGTFRPDADEDGVFDDGDDLCLGTPIGAQVSTDGCQVYRFAADNFGIEINSESCIDSNDGEINIAASDTTLSYEANVVGNGIDTSQAFTDSISFEGLLAGNYTLCITGTDGVNSYEESCFDFVITEPQPLEASSIFDQQNLTATLELQGGTLYNVELNGVVTQTRESQITLNLVNGTNKVRVYTNLACQGEYKETFVIAAGMLLAPNPTQDFVTLFLNDFKGDFSLKLFSFNGRLVKSISKNTNSGRVDLQLSEFPPGMYLLKISGEELNETFKILKR